MQEYTLALSEPVLVHGLRMPIDTLFRSLADQQAARAIAVVLSGTGSDGTLGLRAIKGHDGLTMAQSPAIAQYEGMPHSAIATGLIDVVSPVKSIAERLADYLRHPYVNGMNKQAPVTPAEADRGELQAILAVLQTRTGHDFRNYKQATLQRRIARRMGLHLLQTHQVYSGDSDFRLHGLRVAGN